MPTPPSGSGDNDRSGDLEAGTRTAAASAAAAAAAPERGRDTRSDDTRGNDSRDNDTTEHAVVDTGTPPGGVHVDRSAFGRHEGLFVVNQGPKAGARYALDADLVSVGRDPDSDIFLNDITVSRCHAEVRREGARYWIRDAGSLNGTYINRRLVEDGELTEGDEVQVGKYKLVFVHGTSPV